jgi:predicted peptidase
MNGNGTHTRIETRRALVYAPKSDGPHPILCFLHGAGEAAINQGTHSKEPFPQFIDKLFAHRSPPWQASEMKAHANRFLVISPQLEGRRRWELSDAGWVDDLVYDTLRYHRGDRGRLILTGFSYGGEGVFQLASASALAWRTLWAVDPALQRVPPLPEAGVRVWVHYGNDQPGKTEMEAFAANLGLQKWTGAPNARRVVTKLDADHPGTCAAAYAEAHVYEWLLG